MGKLKSWIWRCSQGKIFQFCSKTQMFKWCPFAWGCNYVSTVRMWATGKRLDMYNDTVSALHEGTKPYWKHKYDTCITLKLRKHWSRKVWLVESGPVFKSEKDKYDVHEQTIRADEWRHRFAVRSNCEISLTLQQKHYSMRLCGYDGIAYMH